MRSALNSIRNPIAVGLAYLARAIHQDILSKWETAIEDCQKAAEAFWAAGNLRGWGGASSICAELFHFKGDFTRSFEGFKNIAKVGQEGADRQIWGWGLWGQGLNLLRCGALGAAEECLQKSLEMHMTVPDYQGMIDAKRDLARCYLYQSKLNQAFEVLENGERIVVEQGLKGPPVTRLFNVSPLGRVLRRTGVNVLTRVLGVLLAALAVQYVADGIRGLLRAG